MVICRIHWLKPVGRLSCCLCSPRDSGAEGSRVPQTGPRRARPALSTLAYCPLDFTRSLCLCSMCHQMLLWPLSCWNQNVTVNIDSSFYPACSSPALTHWKRFPSVTLSLQPEPLPRSDFVIPVLTQSGVSLSVPCLQPHFPSSRSVCVRVHHVHTCVLVLWDDRYT